MDPRCYYRAFEVTPQGNNAMAGKEQWYFWSGLLSTSATPQPSQRLLSVLVDISRVPPCLWSSIKHPVTFRKGKIKKIILVADGTGRGKWKASGSDLISSGLVLWRQRTQQRPEGRGIRRSTAALNGRTKGKKKKRREFSLPKIKRGQSGGCSAKEYKRALGKASLREAAVVQREQLPVVQWGAS